MFDFEDLDQFFTLSAVDVQVCIEGEFTTIQGLFDDQHHEGTDPYNKVSGSQPKFRCKSSDIEGLQQQDWVIIGGIDYQVWDIRPNGTGLSEVYLHTQ